MDAIDVAVFDAIVFVDAIVVVVIIVVVIVPMIKYLQKSDEGCGEIKLS